ncbi:MAG: cob(I)yrinic acid a,c-diamide adenosyltransferase [Patescibacteria group bacterium UBA2163]
MFYTKTGDNGTSGLFGVKKRLAKDDVLYEALGSVDELNSLLGLYRASHGESTETPINTADVLKNVQEHLFIIQAEIAGAYKEVTHEHVTYIEYVIETVEGIVKNPNSFVIPGSTASSAFLDYARAVARRVERNVLRARMQCDINQTSKIYLNRLSSLLYALARYTAHKDDVQESSPTYS